MSLIYTVQKQNYEKARVQNMYLKTAEIQDIFAAG